MTGTVELPVWVLVLVLLFAAVAALDRVLVPSARWFLRRRMEKVVARLNERLARPIEPFKLARREDMIQRLLYDPEVSRAIVEHARKNSLREDVAFEQAERYAREIVPRFSATTYFGIGIRLAKWLANALYRVRQGFIDEGSLRVIDPDATIVFIINHRSNMDYVLVTYLAARASALSYAVGEWARVWPLFRLIQAMGAFFIRRKSRGALYRKVLARYVRMATEGGVTQAVFPEGGLSRDGKLAEPKLGLLSYIVEGALESGRDVVFVPVALNYDRVLEDRILMATANNDSDRFDAPMSVVSKFILHQLSLRLRGRFHRYGYASVSFGTPLSLAEFRKSNSDEVLTEALGREMMDRISHVMPVLPVPLIARLLLAAEGPVPRDMLLKQAETFIATLENAHLHLPRSDVEYMLEVGLRALVERHMIVETPEGFSAAESERQALAFYANSISHVQDPHSQGKEHIVRD